MSFKKSLAALVILAAVAAAYFFYEKPRAERVETEKGDEKKVLTLDWDKVDRIRVQRNGVEEAFAVEKTGEDQWRVKEPFDDDADKYAVQGMTATLRTARADRVLEDPESDLINYGLDKPRLWATIRSGGAETTLQFGANHRIGNSIFAKLGDAPAVMVVPMSVYDAVAKSPDDFRDKTIFPSSFDDPERVELRRGGEEAFVLVRKKIESPAGDDDDDTADDAAPPTEEERWVLEGTHPWWRADRKAVDDLLQGLRGLRVQKVLAERAEPDDENGLLPPRLTLLVKYENKDEVRVDIGAAYSEGDGYLAKPPKGYLATLPKASVDKIDKNAEGLRDRTLADFQVGDVMKAELRRPFGSLIISRPSAGDDFRAEDGSPVRSEKILDDLRRLVDLEGKSFPEKRRLAKAEKALDQPEFSLVLSGAGGEELAVVTMASFSDKGERVVIGRGRPPGVTMELDPSALDGWPERAEDWMAPPEEAARETADDDTAAEAE